MSPTTCNHLSALGDDNIICLKCANSRSKTENDNYCEKKSERTNIPLIFKFHVVTFFAASILLLTVLHLSEVIINQEIMVNNQAFLSKEVLSALVVGKILFAITLFLDAIVAGCLVFARARRTTLGQ